MWRGTVKVKIISSCISQVQKQNKPLEPYKAGRIMSLTKKVLFSEASNMGNELEPQMPDFDDSGPDVKVHPLSHFPRQAWKHLSTKKVVKKITCLSPDTPIYPDKLRFVCVSDTHNRTDDLTVPHGDVLLHSGDFTMIGQIKETDHFARWFAKQSHPHKVVIAGNHELTFDPELLNKENGLKQWGIDTKEVKSYLEKHNLTQMSDLLKEFIYLEDSGVEIAGIKIWGSPWQPEFGGWGFNLIRGQDCLDKWNLIPDNTDVLLTHGPPIGHGDATFNQDRAGCVELLSTIEKRVKPKYHIFGHIHEAYGVTTDDQTVFINASTCTLRYRSSNPPILFDLDIPQGHSKKDVIRRFTAKKEEKEMENVD